MLWESVIRISGPGRPNRCRSSQSGSRGIKNSEDGGWEMTAEEFLVNLVRKWEPTERQKQEVSASQQHLRNLLHESRLPVIDSYLSGSYSRDTALRPIDDVDIIFVVDPSHWSFWPALYRPQPNEVLESFARAIRRRYTLSSVYGQRRSVNLRLSDLVVDGNWLFQSLRSFTKGFNRPSQD